MTLAPYGGLVQGGWVVIVRRGLVEDSLRAPLQPLPQSTAGLQPKLILMYLPLIVLFLLTSAESAFAGRPLVTEDARTVGKGKVQIEAGNYWNDDGTDGRDIMQNYTLTIGLAENLDFQVGRPFIFRIPFDGCPCGGTGDTAFAIKYRFQEESARKPAMAVKFINNLCDGDSVGGSGKSSSTLNFVISKKVGEITLHGNLGYTVDDWGKGFSGCDIINYSLAAEKPLSERFTLVLEVLGQSSRDLPGQASAQIGVTYQLSPSVTLDAGYLKALNSCTKPRGSFTVGVTIVF
jgi:hypothetical protein